MSNRYSSAADAYAPLPSTGSQAQQRNSVYSNIGSQQAGSRGAAAAGTRASVQNANAWAPEEDEEDNDSGEDWNVYDDFNNTRPLSMDPSAAGLGSASAYYARSSQDLSRLGNAGRQYSSSSSYGTPFGDTVGSTTPMDEKRTSLLPASAFGFDVKNGDPREIEKHISLTPDMREKAERHVSMMSGAGGVDHSQSGIELVTVPALGTEFSEEERRKMTRPYKRRSKRGAKKAKFMGWAKGERKLFGFLDPRMAVLISFVFLVFLGILLYFVIPRVPIFEFNNVKPFDAVPDASGMTIGTYPANFSMDMKANLRGNNQGGWIPSVLTDIRAEVIDVNTYNKVGEGQISRLSLPGRKRTVFQFPIHFSYRSLNATGDETFQHFHTACGPIYPGSERPTLNLDVSLTFKVQGLVGRKGASTQFANVVCPFQLQNFQ